MLRGKHGDGKERSMRKAIITGADGFVGSNTVAYFLSKGIEVLALDVNERPRRLQETEGLQYLCCDVSNQEKLLETVRENVYDTMIHFAWKGSAGPEREDYGVQMQNALDTVACMEAAKKLGCIRFLCAGSIMEYEVEAAVHTQGSRMGMAYIYGMGKHVAHCMCKSVSAQIGIDLLWPMITNAYGVGERSPRFINNTLRKIIYGEPLQFTAATQNYDFIYVTDVAKAFYLIAERGKPFCEYMIGSGEAKPLREFILEMQGTLAPDMVPIFGDVPFTGTNMPLATFDVSALREDCGFCPEVSFAEGVRRTMDWMREEERCEGGSEV